MALIISPLYNPAQEQSYAEYAYYHGLIPLGAKNRFDREWAACMESVSVCTVF